MVVAAGIDAAADLDLELADALRKLGVRETPGDVLGDGDRAGVGQGAVVQARAGDDVADLPDVRGRETGGVEQRTCGRIRFCS
jgi:hypothetical protein